jgi:hypothetical protein
MIPWNTPPELTHTVTTQTTPSAFKRFWDRANEATSVSVAYYIEDPASAAEWQSTGAAFLPKVVRTLKPVAIERRTFTMRGLPGEFPVSDD